jgi:hypothetical protein
VNTVGAALQSTSGEWHPMSGRSLFATPKKQNDQRHYDQILHLTGTFMHIVFADGWPIAYENWTREDGEHIESHGGALIRDGVWVAMSEEVLEETT